MAVSKQAYTVSAPWLNFQLADQFRQAFIDAGLMTDWHDSFTTGSGEAGQLNEHRVLRIVYDASKKYGTVFHWLVFLPDGSMDYAYVHQWDAVNNVPLGDFAKERLRQTYGRMTTVAENGTHRIFATQVLSTTTTLTRYSSGERSVFSMFLLKGGNNFQSWFFMPAGTNFQPYIDLQINTCGGLMMPMVGVSNSTSNRPVRGTVSFCHFFHYCDNIFAYGWSATRQADGGSWAGRIAHAFERGVVYALAGRGTSSSVVDQKTFSGDFNSSGRLYNSLGTEGMWLTLPCERAAYNSDRATDTTPVFSDIPYSMYITDRLPIDFGIVGHFTNSTMEVQDIFQVTPGLEEWEILANANQTDTGNPSVFVVARVI